MLSVPHVQTERVTIEMSEILPVVGFLAPPLPTISSPGALASSDWSEPGQVIRGLTLTGGQSAVKWELLRDVQATGYWGESPLTYHLTQG